MNVQFKSQQHHPSMTQLTEFSSGTLPLSKALCVSAHIENCVICQQKLQELNSLGGNLFDNNASVKVSDAIKLKTMRLLSEHKPQVAKKITAPSVPNCLRKFIKTSFDELKWKNLTSKARIAELCHDNGSKVALLRIDAGAKMAHHSHTGEEITVVLKGSFSDEDGIYNKGDFIVRESKDHHTPIASRDSECICLIVLDSAIELRGFWGWLINPFLRKWHLAH